MAAIERVRDVDPRLDRAEGPGSRSPTPQERERRRRREKKPPRPATEEPPDDGADDAPSGHRVDLRV